MAASSERDPLPEPPVGSARAQHQPKADTGQSHATRGPLPGDRNNSLLFAPGARPLPGYELVHLLGRGGFGEVWKAIGPGGFSIALKFIRIEERPGQVEARGLDLMKDIRHAHLLPIFGSWQQDKLLIIAMELADQTLLQRWQETEAQGLAGIPAAELLNYMQQAAKGIDFLNGYQPPRETGESVGIQHKDIKPHNLLLVSGVVKVADFGLVKLLEHTISSATGGMTLAYAPPEFLKGRVTRWSDQYSLAVTYCQMRGGQLPFEGNPAQVMSGHLMMPPKLKMLPKVERPVVARALAKRPEERWPNCQAFVEALASIVTDRGDDSADEHRVQRKPRSLEEPVQHTSRLPPTDLDVDTSGPPKRRWKLVVGAMSGLVVLLLLMSIFWAATGWKEQSPPTVKQAAAPPALVLPANLEVSLAPGQTKVIEVRVQRQNCTGTVDLEVEGLPSKVTAKRETLPAHQDLARLEFTAADDAEEVAKRVRVRASLGALQREQQVALFVRLPPALRLLPIAEVSLAVGQSRAFRVQLQRRKYNGPIDLRLERLPNGVRASSSRRVPADVDAVIWNLDADKAAAPTTQMVRLTAVAGDIRDKYEFRLTVVLPKSLEDQIAENSEAIRLNPQDAVGVTAPPLPSQGEVSLPGYQRAVRI